MRLQFQANGTQRRGVLMAMRAVPLILLAISAISAAAAQDSTLPRFEVASVKPIDLHARNAIDIRVVPGGRVIITAATLTQLIAGAYGGLQMYQISGPPGTLARYTTFKLSRRKTTTASSPRRWFWAGECPKSRPCGSVRC